MILIIDHYDSFVHNLARYVALAGVETIIRRCDTVSIEQVRTLIPEAIILSPGPCTPGEAGISVDLVRMLGAQIPMLGVCLGHQCIGQAYGARIVRTDPIHGQASPIRHDGSDLYAGLPSPFEGGRYHSLAVEPADAFDVTAYTEDGVIMGIRHKIYPVHGVQFHPESILTPQGQIIINNFMRIARRWSQQAEAA